MIQRSKVLRGGVLFGVDHFYYRGLARFELREGALHIRTRTARSRFDVLYPSSGVPWVSVSLSLPWVSGGVPVLLGDQWYHAQHALLKRALIRRGFVLQRARIACWTQRTVSEVMDGRFEDNK